MNSPPDARALRYKSTEADRRLGEHLRELRIAKKLSLAQVATATEVTKPHISSIEKGIHRPSPKLLAKLEDFYGLPPGELFADIQQERPAHTVTAPASVSHRMESITDEYGGIIGIKEGLIIGTLANAIHATEHAIDILDAWITEDLSRLHGPFLEAAGRGIRMQIILLHPELVEQQMEKVGTPPYRTRSADITRANIKTLRLWHQTWHDRWDEYRQERQRQRTTKPHLPVWKEWSDMHMAVYLLPFMPVIQYHRYDDTAFVGFFLHVENTGQAPRLEVQLRRRDFGYDMRTILGRSFWDEFVYLWKLLERSPLARVPLGQGPRETEDPGVWAWSPPPLADCLTEVTNIMQGPSSGTGAASTGAT